MAKVFQRLLIVFAITLFASSCATTISPTALVPSDNETFQSIDKTVTVLPVKIGQRLKPGFTDPLVTFPDATIYRDAVIGTLVKARMFSEVRKEGLADYTLSTE